MKKLRLLNYKKQMFAISIFLIIIIIVVILTRPKSEKEEDVIWREYQAAFNDITASLDGGGVLEATGVHHGFDVDLKVDSILVEIGQEVKTGDVLVKYSEEALLDKIAELNMSLKKAKSALEDAKNNKKKLQLENMSNDDVTQQDTQTTYENSKRELENSIRTAEQNIRQHQEKLTRLKQDLRSSQNSSDGSIDTKELRNLKNKLKKLEEELKELAANSDNEEQITSLEQQKSSLEMQLEEVNRKIDEITSNEGGLDDLQTKEVQLTAEETNFQEAIDGFADESGKLNELKKQKEDLENQITDINAQINSLKDAAKATDTIQKKQAQIDEVQKRINDLSSKEEKLTSLKEQLQQAETDLEGAKTELETHKTALESLESNYNNQTNQNKEKHLTKEQINALDNASLDNAIINAQADLEKIQIDLDKANEILTTLELKAKADGIVTELKYDEGDDVPAQKSVVTIGSSGEKRIVTQVSQEDIGSVEIGQEVEMQFMSAPDNTLKGRVLKKRLVPSEGGDGITYKVTIEFEEEQPELLQGMTCSIKFILKRVEHVLTLSNKAIELKNGKQIVTVLLPDGTHEEREIKTGFSDGRVSEITSGLSDGEVVVKAG